MHPAYKARALAAIAIAQAIKADGGTPGEMLRSILRNAGAGRLKTDRISPRDLALRACGFVPQGRHYRQATGGPASMSWVTVQEYLHRPTGHVARCHA